MRPCSLCLCLCLRLRLRSSRVFPQTKGGGLASFRPRQTRTCVVANLQLPILPPIKSMWRLHRRPFKPIPPFYGQSINFSLNTFISSLYRPQRRHQQQQDGVIATDTPSLLHLCIIRLTFSFDFKVATLHIYIFIMRILTHNYLRSNVRG